MRPQFALLALHPALTSLTPQTKDQQSSPLSSFFDEFSLRRSFLFVPLVLLFSLLSKSILFCAVACLFFSSSLTLSSFSMLVFRSFCQGSCFPPPPFSLDLNISLSSSWKWTHIFRGETGVDSVRVVTPLLRTRHVL
jgi:hypothetical protein